jgi:ABC-type phosphate transport system substrate-binding protein
MIDVKNTKRGYRWRMGRLCAFALLSVVCLLAPRGAVSQKASEHPLDLLIIVNRSNPIESATKEEIKNLFLQKRERWKNGEKPVTVNAPGDSELREAFVTRVLDMTKNDEENFWYRRKIRQGAAAPPQFRNTLKAVFNLKRSVSYTFRKDYVKTVAKIILVVPNKK